MFGITVLTSVLECLVGLPISFTVFQLFLSPATAFLIAVTLCLVSIMACGLSMLKLKTFVYKSISIVVSILLAYIMVPQITIGTFLLAGICIFIFIRVKKNISSGEDQAILICLFSLLYNIAFALITFYGFVLISVEYSNAAILISTIAAIILLILKQTDDSRRFGKNSMRISTTQHKNNQIFGVVSIVLLLAISAIGQVSNIYKLVMRFLKAILDIITPGTMRQEAAQIQYSAKKVESVAPSTFEMIMQKILSVLIVVMGIAVVGFAIYSIAKWMIKLIKLIINWFKKEEKTVLRYYENGHVDEKQSLYNRNLKNMAKRLHDMAVGLFDREIPYNKLPDNIAKTRRLFKNYKNEAQKTGVKISKSSTAEEICHGVSCKTPETEPFNNLLSKCYAAARYGEVEPLPQEFMQLESKLHK